jgi:hypothetical protein
MTCFIQVLLALKKLAENLLDAPDSRLREMISNGDLYEVMT